MPAAQGKLFFDSLTRRWHDLADRRLGHFAELYQSGRWKLYYQSEEQFAAQMLEAIKVARVWARMAGREPSKFAVPLGTPLMLPKEDGMRSAA